MDMAEAIASFLHLAFVFDLKYPKVFYFISRAEREMAKQAGAELCQAQFSWV